MWFPLWSERMYQNCTYLFFFDRLSGQASYFFLVIEPFQSFCLQTSTDCVCVLVHVNLGPHIRTALYINSEKMQSNFRKKLKIAWKVLMLNSGHSSFVTWTVRMSRFHRDNFQRGTEWSSVSIAAKYCHVSQWSVSTLLGRDPWLGHDSHDHFLSKNWKFLAVTFQIQEIILQPNLAEISHKLSFLCKCWCLTKSTCFASGRKIIFYAFIQMCFLRLIPSFTSLLTSILRLTFTLGCCYCLLNCTKWSRTAVTLHLAAMCFHEGNSSVLQECTV